MKHSLPIIVTIMTCLVFGGCKKDGQYVSFVAKTQKYVSDNDEKVFVDDNAYACWSNGDQVKINNGTYTVNVSTSSDGTTAEIRDVNKDEDNNYYAIYPASYCSSTFGNDSSITLPTTIDYAVDANGRQVLKSPMVGTTDNDGVLKFYNLCALLKIRVQPVEKVTITGIKVESTGNGAANVNLSGTGTVTFSGSTPTLGNLSGSTKYVILDLGEGVDISSGAKDFYVPVPAAALANDRYFRITIRDNWGRAKTASVKSHTNSVVANCVALIVAPKMTLSTDIVFKDYLWSQESGHLNVGRQPTNSSKAEITFRLTERDVNQYYMGSGGSKFYFTLRASANVTAGWVANMTQNYSAGSSFSPRNTTSKYQHTLEILHNSSGYYGHALLKNLTTGSSDEISTPYSTQGLTGQEGLTNIYLFNVGTGTGTRAKGMKCYGFRLWERGTLVRDLVPCEVPSGSCFRTDSDSGTKVGMFDKVQKNFIEATLTGTTSFTVGND